MPATPLETFANAAVGIVTSGGTTASSGDNTLTVNEITPFPAASSTASPPTQFRFGDTAVPNEQMTCTNRVLVSGTTYTWTVTRADESSTLSTHQAGFQVRGDITAGIMASLQNFLTYGLQPYFQSVAITPSGTSGTYGTAHVYAPPAGYRSWLPLHVYVQAANIGAETLTVQGTGALVDGTTNSASITLTTTAGAIDSTLLLVASVALANQNAGQQVWWGGTPATASTTTDKRLASYSLAVKSSIGSSGASVNTAIWAVPIP